MPFKPVPEGYHTVTPYLVCTGTDRLIEFMKKAFGAKEVLRTHRPDGSIGHADVTIGNSHIMLGEAGGQWAPRPTTIFLYVPDTDAVYKTAIAAGAKSLMEPADQFYGDRSGGVEDPWGNYWWIGTRIEEVSDEEIQRRANASIKV